jgi:hypothetical protein
MVVGLLCLEELKVSPNSRQRNYRQLRMAPICSGCAKISEVHNSVRIAHFIVSLHPVKA